MAPALTEPLSPTNKLSTSTSSASPRPIPSNLLNSNSTDNTITTINNIDSTINNNTSNNNTIRITRNSPKKYSSFRRSPRRCAFQSAFEETIGPISSSDKPTKNKANNTTASSPKTITTSFLSESNGCNKADLQSPPITKILNSTQSPSIDSSIKANNENIEQMCNKKKLNESVTVNDQTISENLRNFEKLSKKTIKINNNTENETATIISLNSDFEEAINATLNLNTCSQEIFLKTQDIEKQMDLLEQNLTTPATETILTTEIIANKIDVNENRKSNNDDLDLSQEIKSTGTTDTTATASESEMIFDDNFQEAAQVLEHQISKDQKTPQHAVQYQIISTPLSNALTTSTPQSASSMGMQKSDYIKDSSEMDQVLGDMDLLQVLKCFDSTTGGGEALCDLAAVFNDVDVMNVDEELNTSIQKEDEQTIEMRSDIEKRQQKIQRKCDFLLRRLRRIQTKYTGNHASEEISGLFEWTNRLVRLKSHEEIPNLTYEEDKYRTVPITSMRSLLHRIDAVSNVQHSTDTSIKLQKNKTMFGGRIDQKIPSVINGFDEKTTNEIDHVSSLLQSECRQIQVAFDSDATASSSGGESADEMVTYNNQTQESLPIAKRAAWRWARDRSSIAAKWTWLCSQISDLEYRIRQHNELYLQIKKNKGSVLLDKQPTNSLMSPSSSTQISDPDPTNVNGYRNINNAFDDSIVKSSFEEQPPNGALDSQSPSSSCRTRPFHRCGFRKRKLLQTANVHTISKKAAKSSTIKCGCQWPMHPCALCTGRSDPMAPRDLPDTMNVAERVSLLDPSYHSVLSFPEDISNSIHIEGILQQPEWQNRCARNISKLPTKNGDENDKKRKKYKTKKYKQQLLEAEGGTLLTPITNKPKKIRKNHERHISKHKKLLLPPPVGSGMKSTSNNNLVNSSDMNGFQNAFAESLGSINCDNLDGASPVSGQVPRSKNSSPTPHVSNSSNSYKYERMLDRRNRNSYDIDNIVIPYSVAAATRVEILPYKEIPTPKWRTIEDEIEELNELHNSKSNDLMFDDATSLSIKFPSSDTELENLMKFDDDDKNITSSESGVFIHKEITGDTADSLNYNLDDSDEDEDISDEAILQRHERALLEERRKFSTYLKFPWSTRSRANRRIDSRCESSGANTPDPSSPAPNTPSVGGCDQESIPSPAAPSTPLTASDHFDIDNPNTNPLTFPSINTMLSSISHKKERRRTVSAKKDHFKDEASRSTSPDPRDIIPPYEPLLFPLSDDFYDTMINMMPNDHFIESSTKSLLNDFDADNFSNTNNIDLKSPRFTSNNSKNISRKNSLDYLNNNDNSIFSIPTNLNNIKPQSDFDSLPQDKLMLGDSDTDSVDLLEEDPNDPEWKEEPEKFF